MARLKLSWILIPPHMLSLRHEARFSCRYRLSTSQWQILLQVRQNDAINDGVIQVLPTKVIVAFRTSLSYCPLRSYQRTIKRSSAKIKDDEFAILNFPICDESQRRPPLLQQLFLNPANASSLCRLLLLNFEMRWDGNDCHGPFHPKRSSSAFSILPQTVVRAHCNLRGNVGTYASSVPIVRNSLNVFNRNVPLR